MSEQHSLDCDVQQMRRYFFVPPAPDNVFSLIDHLVNDLDANYLPIAKTFRHNLASVVSSVSMPFRLASSSVRNNHFQRIYAAERIRARSIEASAIQPGESLEDVRDREAYRMAQLSMSQFEQSEQGKSRIIRDICHFLLANLKAGDLDTAARELVQQGIVLLWSAFEILFRDTFELEININPSKVFLLAQDSSSRKRAEFEKISLSTLMSHEFDVSEKLRTILVGQQDFSDLPTIKTVYSVLFGSCANLIDCLNDISLWKLYQQRHLFVHRRGVVDQSYVDNIRNAPPLGSILQLTPDDFEEHLNTVLNVGEALFRCLNNKRT